MKLKKSEDEKYYNHTLTLRDEQDLVSTTRRRRRRRNHSLDRDIKTITLESLPTPPAPLVVPPVYASPKQPPS